MLLLGIGNMQLISRTIKIEFELRKINFWSNKKMNEYVAKKLFLNSFTTINLLL